MGFHTHAFSCTCLWGEFLLRLTVVERRELIWGDAIWGAIREFLQHHAPINHVFNQPETPFQQTADEHIHRHTLQCKKKRRGVKKKKPCCWLTERDDNTHSGVGEERTKDKSRVAEWRESKGGRVKRHSSPRLAGVSAELSSASLVIGSESLWGGGQTLGRGWGLKSLSPEPISQERLWTILHTHLVDRIQH